jgi:hypothetical protein
MSDPKTVLNNARLKSDLDAQGHKILNLPNDQPLPPPIIPSGAITDINVATNAGIQQGKLNLNGMIPTAWLGNTATTAATGNLAEYQSNKAQSNGYCDLDSSGLIPTARFPALMGTGTVTSVGIATANGVSGSPTITGSGNITIALGNISPTSVVISGSGGAGFITFAAQTSNPSVAGNARIFFNSVARLCFGSSESGGFVMSFEGDLLTADRNYKWPDKFGTVAMTVDIPVTFVGVGGSHTAGLVPDPGSSGTTTDYLARDATWKALPTSNTYQPVVPTVSISPSANTTGARTITLGDSLGGVSLFYEIGSNTGPFLPYPAAISLDPLATIYAYASKSGYTNSVMASYTNPNTS